MSNTYFNFALFYFQALFTTWPAYVRFDGPAHFIIYCVCCKYLCFLHWEWLLPFPFMFAHLYLWSCL